MTRKTKAERELEAQQDDLYDALNWDQQHEIEERIDEMVDCYKTGVEDALQEAAYMAVDEQIDTLAEGMSKLRQQWGEHIVDAALRRVGSGLPDSSSVDLNGPASIEEAEDMRQEQIRPTAGKQIGQGIPAQL